MLVALDNRSSKAVLGSDLKEQDLNGPRKPDTSTHFSCLMCGSTLEYNPDPEGDLFGHFVHLNCDENCFRDGNMSHSHRLGQEVASKIIYNWLPVSKKPSIDLEKRIGNNSDFIIADILVSNPEDIVIEIVYLNTHIDFRRRLETIFERGYSAMFIFLTTGRISPERIDHHLTKISSIRAGRFNPNTLDLRLGSLITPDRIDLEEENWELLPKYLS